MLLVTLLLHVEQKSLSRGESLAALLTSVNSRLCHLDIDCRRGSQTFFPFLALVAVLRDDTCLFALDLLSKIKAVLLKRAPNAE
jgi:hypothetical protein